MTFSNIKNVLLQKLTLTFFNTLTPSWIGCGKPARDSLSLKEKKRNTFKQPISLSGFQAKGGLCGKNNLAAGK